MVLYGDRWVAFQIKEKQVKDAVIYIILLIGLDGKKEIGGWYIEFGKENKTDWIKIFNDLISRPLKRVLIVVSDDFPGLSESIESIFPKSDHQLCWIHFIRNAKRNMGKNEPDTKFLTSALSIPICLHYHPILI